MSSCPNPRANSLDEFHQFHLRDFHHISSGFSSQTSLESFEASIEFDVDVCDNPTDFPFSLNIPTVVLRKHRSNRREYFVYMIHIYVRDTSAAQISNGQTLRLEWTVGHRYTTLAKLHADLLGQNMNAKRSTGFCCTEDEDDGEEKEEEQVACQCRKVNTMIKKHRPRPMAHACLPRPLPGLDEFQFPRKRTIPTIPALAAGRVPFCFKTGSSTDWITCQPDFVDYPVDVDHSHRVDQRRRALEQYLNHLLRLVWCVSQTREVANAINSMLIPEPGCDDSQRISEDKETPESSRNRLINLLPILSENWN